MSDQQVKVGRLAFRREGERINAYWAKPDTMAQSVMIGSILVSVCDADEKVWEGFKDLMRDAFSGIVFQEIGIRPIWGGEESAPEHERAGRA